MVATEIKAITLPPSAIILLIKLGVILGSIRGIRRGGRVAKWLKPQLEQYKDFEIELLDLNDFSLPFFNESNSPEGLEGNYTDEATKRWSAKIAEKIELQMTPVREAIHIANVLGYLDEDGHVLQGHLNERLVPLMSELTWRAKALKAARDQDQN